MNKQFSISSNDILKDIKIVENFCAKDTRGYFTKIYNEDIYENMGIKMDLKEVFYSVSDKNVIRGMHYQEEPYGQDKFVHVLSGAAIDVIMDIRKNSSTYGRVIGIPLDGNDKKQIYIPKGFAHGFKALEDNTVLIYEVSCGYNREADKGIRWDSINFDWAIDNPIISERDSAFIAFAELG